jgi:hypothetical protein
MAMLRQLGFGFGHVLQAAASPAPALHRAALVAGARAMSGGKASELALIKEVRARVRARACVRV